ncbi:MAG: OFA family MFS transporter [Polyangia bacterium]|jgi:OFA family oxalate/formate antiporter-like MFS transporter|nr:OFA family MFS transporter [Polyangia bacterium]
MPADKVQNRWLVVVGALLIQISLGAIYIYSVFKPALAGKFPSWSPTDLALPSQLVLAFFALSMVFFGRIQDKFGPRIIASLGGVLLGAGLIVASFAPNLAVFVLGFSVIGGIGIGAAYVCPIATCVKWFPDKRGLITGLAVAGFGAGGLVFTPIAKSLVASVGVMQTFLYLGIIFLVAVLLGAQLMNNPPAGFKPEGWTPPAPAAGAAAPAKADYAWTEMLKTIQFWLLWLTYFAACTAGLMVIMNVVNVWQSVSFLDLKKAGEAIPKETVLSVLGKGATAVIIVAVFNAVGRIAWGKISDSLGRKPTLILMFVLSGVTMLGLYWMKSYALFVAGASMVGLCFGGFLALYPAVTADFFGTKNVGANYGFMFSAYGAGGLFGPWLAPKLMELVEKVPYFDPAKGKEMPYPAGNYMKAFVISGALCLVAAVLIVLLKPPTAKEPAAK